MKNAELNKTLINSYYELFRKLSAKGKKELISKLTESLGKKKTKSSTTIFSTFGAFITDESAQEIIEDIRVSRTFNRNTADL